MADSRVPSSGDDEKDTAPSGGPNAPKPPKMQPRPGYKWVWNGSAWVETRLTKDERPTQTLPEGLEWMWNDSTGWGFRRINSNPGDSGPGTGGDGTRPPAPGVAWIWNGTNWVQPPKPAGDYVWNDNTGWVEDTQRKAQKQSARETLQSWFEAYGIDDTSTEGGQSLSSLIYGWVEGDKSMDWIKLELRKTDQYKARFPGMDALSKKGMAISEAEYISNERAYLQVLSAAGFEKIYGTRSNYASFMTSEVSPQELASRVQMAKDYVNMAAPASVKEQLRTLYGMTNEDMAAYMLDTSEGKKQSLAALESEYTRRVSQANVSGAAQDVGLGLSTPLRDQIASMGYDYNRSAAGLSQVRTEQDPYRRLGQLYGVQTSTDELVQETFGLGGGAEATTKKRKLASRERAAFAGSSALGQSSLSANRIGQV